MIILDFYNMRLLSGATASYTTTYTSTNTISINQHRSNIWYKLMQPGFCFASFLFHSFEQIRDHGTRRCVL